MPSKKKITKFKRGILGRFKAEEKEEDKEVMDDNNQVEGWGSDYEEDENYEEDKEMLEEEPSRNPSAPCAPDASDMRLDTERSKTEASLDASDAKSCYVMLCHAKSWYVMSCHACCFMCCGEVYRSCHVMHVMLSHVMSC